MAVGEKRTMVARVGATLGVLCGVIGLLAGLTQHSWILGPWGWFAGGSLLTLLAVYALVDGAIAFEKTRLPK
jgi:bacteriorhodopsin